MFQNSKFKIQNNGFSLIEIVVAIGIITVGLMVIVTLFNQNIKSEIRNKNKLIATYLANESIEVIRQQRDNTWFKGGVDTWMHSIPTGDVAIGLDDSGDIRKGWEIVTSDSGRRKIYLSDNSYVQHKDSAINWVDWGWKETAFERYLTITTGVGASGCLAGHEDDCMKITSRILLDGVQITEVTAYLYDKWH